MAIISGCLGLIFIFAFLLAIFVLRIKCHRTLSTELGETGWRSTDDPSQGHNHTVITVGEEAQIKQAKAELDISVALAVDTVWMTTGRD